MAETINWPATTNKYFGWNSIYSGGFYLPTGRLHADGSTRTVKIYAVRAWVSGRTVYANPSASNVQVTIGGAAASWGIGYSSSAAADSGWRGSNVWWYGGGGERTTITYDPNSRSYAEGIIVGAIDDGGQTIYDNYGRATWSGQRLAGGVAYTQAPSGPASLSVSDAGAGNVNVSWSSPVDNGGESINGYRLQYSTASNFSSNVTTVNPGTSGSHQVNVTQGVTWYFRITARNYVTDTAGTLGGEWSGTASVTTTIAAPIWTDKILGGTMRASTSYSDGVTASTSYGSVVYSISAGALPPGLSLNSTNGLVSGTIDSSAGAQTYNFSITASNGVKSVTESYTRLVLSVASAWTKQSINSDFRMALPYSDYISANGTGIEYFVVDGTESPSGYFEVVPGVLLNRATGEIEGTPTSAGTYDVTLRATNDSNENADPDLSFTIIVKPTGKRYTAVPPAFGYLQTIKKYSDGEFRDVKILKRNDGGVWVNLEG